MQRHGLLAAASLCLLLPSAAAARAEEFRIVTKVYSGKDKTPVSTNTTLFQGGYVYDYSSESERVAVFDEPHGRFILLDPARKEKSEIKTADVAAFAEELQGLVSRNSNAFLRFAGDPQFNVEFKETGELTLGSEYISYRLLTEPAVSPVAARQYRDFSDWFARLNAMTNPGSTPPFPRMAVNAELADRGLVPTEVQLTIAAHATLGVRAQNLRSEHHVSWRLIERDAERIATIANQLGTFKEVEYRPLQTTAVSKK
jgi:hypothetical protein